MHPHHARRKPHKHRPALKRSLGLFDSTMYGIGIIIGAGIYALIGEGAGIAGNAVWLSFVIGAVVAAFTGLSYCELSSMIPKEAAEYNYTKRAFNKKVAFVVGWVLLLSMIVAASTVAMGFSGYFSRLVPFPIVAISVVLIILLSIVNFWGIKESSKFNIIATLIEVGGLIIVIAVGLMFFNPSIDVNYSPSGFGGIMAGAVLMFFAFIGFEDVANISEETKNAKKVVPKALLIALAVSTILYILVALAAVSVVGWETLSSSNAPMAEILGRAFGPNAAMLMVFIALFSTGNTVLISLVVASRMMYGISNDSSLPKVLAKIHPKTQTPYIAVFVSMIAAIAFVLLGDIKLIAEVTTSSIFIAYLFVNLSLIALRYRMPDAERPFRVPFNIGKFPVISALGAITVVIMLLYSNMVVLAWEMGFIVLGLGIYYLYTKLSSRVSENRKE